MSFKGLTVVSKETHRIRGYSLDEYRALARLAAGIDFDCGFKDGVCRGREEGEPGCCHGCAETFGHWLKEDGLIDDDTAAMIEPLFDSRSGFMREGRGCILPHELRSPTCLFIYCSDVKMSGEDLDILWRIRDGAGITCDRRKYIVLK